MTINSHPVACSQKPVARQGFSRRIFPATSYRLRATGFSLIELMVVAGIIVVISSVVLFNNTKYGGSVLLQNLAYSIALSVREAQIYGISVRGSGSSNFNAGYGMHFAISDNNHYELFADKDNNGLFTDASENVPPSPYVIGRGYYIYKLCAPAGTKPAVNSYTCTNATQIDLQFKRPEPDACISMSGQSALTNSHCTGGYESARIILASPRGDLLSVVVDATGQISVQ